MSQYANMMSLFLSLTSELFADDITSSLAGALDSYYIAFSAGSIWQWNEKGRPPPCDCIWSGFIIVSSLVCCYVYLPHQFFIFRFFFFLLLFHSASNNNCNPCSKKYVMLCAACGGLAIILGSLFAVLYVVLRSYTSSLHYFETVPSYVASVSVKLTI